MDCEHIIQGSKEIPGPVELITKSNFYITIFKYLD